MIEKVKAPTSVYSFYDHKTKICTPVFVFWEGIRHKTKTIGYHHSYRSGKTLYHVYSIESDSMFFRLVCNTENLSWEITEVSDGLSD